MRFVPSMALLALGVWLAPVQALAADYYVAQAPTGDDGNAGSQTLPFATLQHAADIVGAGDTVHVAAGSYVGFGLQTAGQPNAPITFVAEGAVLVDQPGSSGIGNPNDNITLWKAHYAVLDGFTVTAAPRAGIAVRGDDTEPINGATVVNCHSYDNTTWGIFTAFAENVRLERNICSGSAEQHGIYHSNSGDHPVIRGNVLFGNAGCGLHMNGDASMGGDGMITGALVEDNVSHDNGTAGGSGINCDGVESSIIRNNLLYNNHASGISLYQGDSAAGASNDVVTGNTVLQPADGRWCLNIGADSTGTIAFDNIFYSDHAFRGAIALDASALTGFHSDYNVLVDRNSTDTGDTVLALADWQALGYDTHSLLSTPAALFVAPGSDDYHLLAGAPAVDLGVAALGTGTAPSYDLEGTARPQGAGYDCGCYERCPDDGCVGGGEPDGGPPPDAGGGAGGTGAGGNGQGNSGAGNSGAAGTGASNPGNAAGNAEDEGGCGCRTAAPVGSAGALGVLALGGSVLGLGRRRRNPK